MSRTIRIFEKLTDGALTIATIAAVAWLRKNQIVVAEPIVLHDCISRAAEESLQSALDDAQDAIQCGMSDVAVATFNATMHLAGYRAAAEYAQSVQSVV